MITQYKEKHSGARLIALFYILKFAYSICTNVSSQEMDCPNLEHSRLNSMPFVKGKWSGIKAQLLTRLINVFIGNKGQFQIK